MGALNASPNGKLPQNIVKGPKSHDFLINGGTNPLKNPENLKNCIFRHCNFGKCQFLVTGPQSQNRCHAFWLAFINIDV